MTLVLQ